MDSPLHTKSDLDNPIQAIGYADSLAPKVEVAYQIFLSLVKRFGNGKEERAEKEWTALQDAYADIPNANSLRNYHNFNHPLKMLGWWSLNPFNWQSEEQRVASFFAILYHDAIYWSGESLNEARSAALAVPAMHNLGFPADIICMTVQEILATDYSLPHRPLSKLYVPDFDLVGLARPWEQVAADGERVRDEFRHVPDALFFAGRAKFFGELLNKGRLFDSGIFQHTFTRPAMENIRLIIEDCLRRTQEAIS